MTAALALQFYSTCSVLLASSSSCSTILVVVAVNIVCGTGPTDVILVNFTSIQADFPAAGDSFSVLRQMSIAFVALTLCYGKGKYYAV
jgi:hypothetical protein